MANWLVAATMAWIACVSLPSSGAGQSIQPAIKAATHKELGQKIGTQFKDVIKSAMTDNTFFTNKMLPHNMTAEGATIYTDMFKAVNESLPQYLEEVEGMAEGSGVDFSMLFLWNMQFEMKLLLQKTIPTPSCSDIYIKRGSTEAAMGHNEDNGPPVRDISSYMVSAEIAGLAGLPPDDFTAFCYPGQLCGNAFGFNRGKAVVFTSNALFPKNVNTKAIPRNFLNRAIISLSYPEVPEFLKRMPCSSGFSLNIGDLRTLDMSNVEVSSDSVVQTKYGNGSGFHFNMYLHSEVEQREDASSIHRLQRVKELEPLKSINDIPTVLGDTKDEEYPIFRSASPPDTAATLATGIYNLQLKILQVFQGNPATEQPKLAYKLMNF